MILKPAAGSDKSIQKKKGCSFLSSPDRESAAFFNRYQQKKSTAKGRVFICRLFQRSYFDEYSSLANTIQWTCPPYCLALRSLSLFLLYWLYCDVRSEPAALSGAFSEPAVLTKNATPFETYLLKILPLLFDRCDNPKMNCSIQIPILHLSGFRFRLYQVFIRPVH